MPFKVDGEVEIRNRLSVHDYTGDVDNGEVLRFENNVISSQITDGDIQIAPNGSGDVYLGLISSNSQITNSTDITISGDTISTNENQNINLTTTGTGVVNANGINFSNGLIYSSITNGSIELRPNGTGILKLGSNLELRQNDTTTFNSLPASYNVTSLTAANVGTTNARHLVLNGAGNGYIIVGNLGLREGILQNVVDASDVTVRRTLGGSTNDLVLSSGDVSIVRSSGSPTFKLKTSSSTILSISDNSGTAKFDASGFSFVNGSNAYLGASNSGIAVMKSGAASEALDVSGNIAATGNVVAGGNVSATGNVVAGTGLTVTSGDVTVSSGNMSLTSGNLSLVNGNLVVSGTVTDSNGIIVSTPWTISSSSISYNTGNVGIGTTSPISALDVAGNINFTGTLYQNGLEFTGDSQWTLDGSDIVYSAGKVTVGSTELENNVISSTEQGEALIGKTKNISGSVDTGYAAADGSSKSVYDYYHASKVMDSYDLVPALSSNTSSSAGSVVGNGTHGLIAEYYKGYAWNTLMNTVHDTQINYGNNAQFMSKVREYSGSFNRMFSVKWSGNLTLPAGSYDLIIDDAILAPANHTVTDLFESGPYDEVNQPHVDSWYNTSWAYASYYALMNGMRLPYASEILERRELGVDLKAAVAMWDDIGISDIDAWTAAANTSQWQYSANHYLSITTGGAGAVDYNFGIIDAYTDKYDEFALYMRSDCRLFDTRYIDNDYNQPNMDENTNKGSWASKKRFAEAVGGRLPTIQEVRARKFLQTQNVKYATQDVWIPCTNSDYNGAATDPSADYVQIGHISSHYFGRSVRDNETWPNSSNQWQTNDNFNSYETLTLVIFDNMDQALSYNGLSVTGSNIVSKTVSGPYTKKYSISVPDNGEYAIEFSKNGQGYRQLLLSPQNGDRKRWLTPLDFSVSHSSVVDRYKAFDGSLADEFTSLNYIREPIGWVGTSKTMLDSVVLGAKSGSELFMPRLFDVEGTVDGVHWKRLKSFGAVRSYSEKEFVVGSELGCIGYRIVVLGTFMSGVDDVVKLASLQFKTRGYESFVVPSESGKMINLTNTDEDVYITSNSGVVNVADVAFKDNSLFVRKLENETDIGRLIDWNGTSAIPEGYVIADGAEYSGEDYPEAYKKSLEDTATVHNIVPALKSNTSSLEEGEVVTGSETVPNGLIAHCYDTNTAAEGYTYFKTGFVSNIDIDNIAFNALFNIDGNVSGIEYAAIDFEGYLYIASPGNYSFYAKVDDRISLIIDDEPVAYRTTATGNNWVNMSTDSGSTSDANPTFLSQGYHKIRCRLFEITSTAFIHLAMAAEGTLVGNISDSNIIPSSSFVPYRKEDYYKVFDKKSLLTISPDKLDWTSVQTNIPGMEKNSMAIRSSMVAFYEYIGWYASQEYVITHFTLAPYNFSYYYSYAVDFELQGSNDNSNWTTVQSYAGATQSSINYVNPYGNGYRGYRVKVLSNNTISGYGYEITKKIIVCNELGFYGVRLEDYHKHIPRNLVPVMTSNTTPRGVAIAASVLSSNEPWKAFDNDNTTYYHSTQIRGAALDENQYIGWYDTSLVRKKIITGFSIYARDISWFERRAVYFKLQGTLDGTTWYDIETFSNTYMKIDSYVEYFVVSKDKYVECNGFRILIIAPNVGSYMDYFNINFMQVWAFDHGVFNVPNVSGKLFKLYEGTNVLKLGKNTDAPYVEYDTTGLGTQKTLADPVPAGFVSIDTDGAGSTTLDVEDYPELIDKHIKVNTEKSLVPTLTSATSEGLVVSSGTNTTYGHYDYEAFGIPPVNLIDHGVWHDSIDGISGSATVGWYNLALEKKKILRSFVLYGRVNSSHYDTDPSPKKFNVQGTNDGVNWTTIETFSDVPRYRSGRRFIVSPSNVSSGNAYLGFRLDILDGFMDSSSTADNTTEVASPSNIKGTFISFIQFYCIDLETDVLQQPMVFSLVPRHDGISNPGGTLVNSYPRENPPTLYTNDYDVQALFNDSLDTWWETKYIDGFNVSPHELLYIGWYNTSLSSKVILVSVFLHANYPRIENGNGYDYRSGAPVAFDIQGTIDGTNWYFVEHVSIPIVYTSYRYVITNRSTAYKGYRLVLKDPSYGKFDTLGTPATGTLLLLGELDLECVNESDLKTLTLANNAGKMLKVSNGAEMVERLNDNLVEVGSLALDTLRGNNELAVGATRKWNGVGYVPRGFAVMRGQRLGTLDYPKVFEALVDLQTPFLINPAMTTETLPSGVVVYSSEYSSSSGYKPEAAFNRGIVDDLVSWLSQGTAVYPEHIGWYDTAFDKKKILMEFYLYARFYDAGTDFYGQHMPGVFSVQGTLDGSNWTTIQTYDMMFTGNNGYDKGVFIIDEVNRHTAYYGFRLLIFNRVGNQGSWIGLQEISFYVTDEPSKPVVLQPKPLVPNYTDWDNPSGNLVYSSSYSNHGPWRAFNNEYINSTSSGTAFGWASADAPIDRLNAEPYMGEYIGWYNTQLLKKKVLIYTRWTIGYVNTNRYNHESVLEGFIQGTLDGVNWENIQGFNTGGRYIEYYLNNDNRNKAYYGFRVYVTKNQANSSSYVVVLDSLQFMCLDEDEYFSFELPDSPDTLVNLERVQGIAVEGSIGTNSRGDGLSIVMDNNKDTNNAMVVHNNSQSMFKIRNDRHILVNDSIHIGSGNSRTEAQHYNYEGVSGKVTFMVTMKNNRDYPVFAGLAPASGAASSLIDNLTGPVLLLGGYPGSNYIRFYGRDYGGTKSSHQLSGSNLFTGQHQNYIDEPFAEPAYNAADYVGLIMVSTGKNAIYKDGKVLSMARGVDINDTLPVLKLSRTRNCKAVFGVSTNRENMHNDRNDYDYNHGFCTDLYGRVRVNGVGEGGIWVCNVNGVLENGDYVTSCEIPGYGMKQDDDLLHNYTVAKVTMDCDFSDVSLEYKTLAVQEQDLKYYRCGETVLTEDAYYDLPEEEKKKYTEFTDKEYVVQRDSEGYLVWKTGEEVEVQYKLRYLLPDGTLLSKEEYNECMENGNTAYIAAFVGCTYHCG